ncbi:MAG TPA: tetratricopeptide repeat protein [Chthoniobacterales bacterium]|nr:tetratricopeptide repeat protein [Chthoniobacterales bacterium]
MSFSRGLVPRSLRPQHYLFFFVFALRAIALARLTSSPFMLPAHGDMHFYNEWAQRILHGRLTDHLAFYGLPLYAYLLAMLYTLFGYDPFVPALLQALIDAGTAVLVYQIGARIFSSGESDVSNPRTVPAFFLHNRGKLIGALTAVGWALFVPAQAYAVILMPMAYSTFVFWLVVWLIVRNDLAPTARECFLLGLLIGVSAMTVATILVLVPLVMAALVFKGKIDRPRLGTSIALGVTVLFGGIATGTSPCWIHNYFVGHDSVILSGHSGINFWIGNNPTANGYPKFPPGLHAGQTAMLQDSISQAEAAVGHHLKRAEVSAYWSSKAREYITTHFAEWLMLVLVKIRNFWNAFQYDDLSVITNLREVGVILRGIYFGIVAVLAVPGMVLAWHLAPRSRWVTAAILLQMLALLPVFVTERYRLAAVPGLLLLAAFGLSTLWQACVTKQFRCAVVYFALLITSAIAVSLPQRDPSLWALDAYNSGWHALETDDLSLAEKKLDIAYAYVPGNAEINFALGNLRFAQNDNNGAKSFYLAALRLDPNHGGAYNNLGILALQDSQWTIAEKFFAKAVQQDPTDAKTYYLLAQAELNARDLHSASDAITRALQLNSSQPEFRRLNEQVQRARSIQQP